MQKHVRMDELHHAFEEAERQTETFTFNKLPKQSYSNLSRTNSGLLSQLMHPDPQALPDVYRRGYSSGDLTEKPRLRAPQLHPSQSAAALPVAAQVHVGSVRNGGPIKSGNYRPKARPNEEEMEDETDGEDNSLNVSNSVAQEKLKAIFGNMRGGGANANANKVVPIRPPHIKDAPRAQAIVLMECPVPPVVAMLECTITEPVAVPTFPYNLPVAAIPVSPRTTRQWMLRTEMSESVRTNLLWQRKMDKRLMPLPPRNKSSTVILTIPSVVKLTERKAPPVDGGMRAEQEREEARDEIRRVNLMRNKSWAADYHPQ
ncbi:hypothetical protein BDZ89DRAFT_403784 [Hymenopellis radicata]|nr:hypothetical protein BDZ89DRAFT_403784 [Hymenopellis radicata]